MRKKIIDVKNLSKTYQKNNVLNGVSFSLYEGSICGLIGENGAGKTTLIKILAGLISKDSGEVFFYGNSDEESIRMARKKSSFIVETPYIVPDMTAYENLNLQRIQRGIKSKDRIEEVLKIVGLENTGNKKAAYFSLGMKQRLGIAIALLEDIDIMVLDEPTNGLDPQGIIDFRNMILKLNKEYGITILISSHILSELAKIVTDYVFISKGKLIRQLTSDELKHQCQRKYKLCVSDVESACQVLQCNCRDVKIEKISDEEMILTGKVDIKQVAKVLCENKIYIYEFYESTMTLEQYYISMMGGTQNESNI